MPGNLDPVAYRTGFEDGLDTVWKMLSERQDVPAAAKEEVLAFIMRVRDAKAEGILADIELYRMPVRVIVARARTER